MIPVFRTAFRLLPTAYCLLPSFLNGDGTWGRANHPGERILDTCWAILFLRRATRHIARQKVYTQ